MPKNRFAAADSWVIAVRTGALGAMCAGYLGTTACGGQLTTPRPTHVPSPDTTLGVGDSFVVRIYGEEQLSGSYQVAGDGSIDFPFIGRVLVTGKEPTAVAAAIRDGLREGGYLTNPQVSVLVTEYASKQVSVMGAVAKPGVFPLTNGLTVIHAIGLAGGLTALADGNDVIVSRRVNSAIERFRVPVDDVTEGRADDFPLQAGDIIYVPQRVF